MLVNTDEAVADIGLAALMANDLMLPFVPSNQDGTLEKLTNLFPFADYMSTDGDVTKYCVTGKNVWTRLATGLTPREDRLCRHQSAF